MILPSSAKLRGANRSSGARRPAGIAAARYGPIAIAFLPIRTGALPLATRVVVSPSRSATPSVGPEPGATLGCEPVRARRAAAPEAGARAAEAAPGAGAAPDAERAPDAEAAPDA